MKGKLQLENEFQKGKGKGKGKIQLENEFQKGKGKIQLENELQKGKGKGKFKGKECFSDHKKYLYNEEFNIIKAVSIAISGILRHGHKQGNWCVDLNKFKFFNNSMIPWLSIEYLYECFKQEILPKENIPPFIQVIIDTFPNWTIDKFWNFIDKILNTNDCRFIIHSKISTFNETYIGAKNGHSDFIIKLNKNIILNLIPPFKYTMNTIVGHFTTSYAFINGISKSGIKSMDRNAIAFTLLNDKQSIIDINSDIENRHIKHIQYSHNDPINIYALIISMDKLLEIKCGFSTDLDKETKFTIMFPNDYEFDYLPIEYFDVYKKINNKFELETNIYKYQKFIF